MNNKLERIGKETVVGKCKVTSRNLSGGYEEHYGGMG
jgi:hypothetical protein